jgi:hypothetical protein
MSRVSHEENAMTSLHRRLLACLGSALAGALVVTPAPAHHSPAVLYDMSKQVELEGIVTEFRMGNPHARIYLDVTAEDGTVEHWMTEGGSRTVLLRTGWTGDEIKAGDRVKVVGQPARDGSKVVHWQWIYLADGTQLFGEDLNPDLLEERRSRR